MNRNKRRAENVRLRASSPNWPTAVHEAGHAVGRLLTAQAMGFSLEDAVARIEIGGGQSMQSGSVLLAPEATCIGPAMSLELQRAYNRANPEQRKLSTDEFRELMWSMTTIEQRTNSARSKMLIIAMGPAAEARLTKRRLLDVLNDLPCTSDLKQFHREGFVAGLDTSTFETLAYAARKEAEKLVATPAIWEAIKAVASRLKSELRGAEIARIATPILAPILSSPMSKLAA